MTKQTLNIDLDQLESELPPPPGATGPAPAKPGAAPVKPAPGPAPVAVNTGEMITTLLDITFNMGLAPTRGEHCRLKPEHCTQLGAAYGAVVDKYMPNFKTGPEMTAILVTIPIAIPVVMGELAGGKPTAAKQVYQEAEKIDPDIVHKGKKKPNGN